MGLLWQNSFVPDDWNDRRDALPQGSVLRDYTIEEVLGHGGFGIVYKARHKELDHVVAIKEYLPSELAVREGSTIRAKSVECETHFADGLRRFREEAKALIEFQQHPSIVDCREFFRANGTAYLVMEYVEGLPLSGLLRQREAAGQPFTEYDLLAIAIPLAQGLAHIHRAGVIHRDIKPANILVRRADQQPVLIDFGAAKQAVAEHSRSLAPYTDGYAALEQVAAGQLGPWTDLYGYGAVLWRMVAGGNRPWDPPNPVKAEGRANARVRQADDPLPTAKELGAGRFAEQLLEAIDGCLQLRDTDRIRESDAVVQMLQGKGGEHQQAATAEQEAEVGNDVDLPDSVSEGARTGRLSVRRAWKIVGAVAAITAAVTLATVSLIPRNESSETPSRWSFSIEVEPSTATIALLNGPEEYRQGMLLGPGQYEIEVSAPGFATHRERVTHLEPETLHKVQLERLPVVESGLAQTQSDAATQASDLTVEQERVPAKVADGKQPPEEPRLEPIQTASEERLEMANSTTMESEQVSREGSNASKTVVTDRAVASDAEKTDAEGVPPSNCGTGAQGWADCFELGESYREGIGVPRDTARAAEYYKQACEGGYAAGCGALGYSYSTGEGVELDKIRAAELYRLACVGGDARGCYNLGVAYNLGLGVPQDPAHAAELYRRACEVGYAEGCRNFGVMYDRGEGVKQDQARAVELYDRACEGGDTEGCYNLGVSYRDGTGVGQDQVRAVELHGRACEGGHMTACYSLGLSYHEGTGVKQDQARAAELYARACEAGYEEGCHNLGVMYNAGEGVGVDYARAAELYRIACIGGVPTSCKQLGHLYVKGEGVERDPARAVELYEIACDSGDAPACGMLGFLYNAGDGVGQDQVRAAEFYQQGCDGGDAGACGVLGMKYAGGVGVTEDPWRAMELLQQGCDGGDAPACGMLGGFVELYRNSCEVGGLAPTCTILGDWYNSGNGVPLDRVRAAQLYQRACDGGNAMGCTNLGLMYDSGEGVNEDKVRAAELYGHACDGGVAMGCHNLGVIYATGEGVGEDRARAAELFRRACEGGLDVGCYNIGLAYYFGQGVSPDKSVAQELFQRACEGGHQDACERLETLDWK